MSEEKADYEKELEIQIEKRKNWKGCGSELQRGGLCSKNDFCSGCLNYVFEIYELEKERQAYKKGKQEERERMLKEFEKFWKQFEKDYRRKRK